MTKSILVCQCPGFRQGNDCENPRDKGHSGVCVHVRCVDEDVRATYIVVYEHLARGACNLL